MEKQYDFVAIGDTVVDAFIRLKEASIHCKEGTEDCEICMRFADKIPYQDVYVIPAVGNSANAAVSAARLGLASALVTNIGGDSNGRDCMAALAKQGVATEYVKVHPEEKTNYHYVLWYEDDRTILIKHEKYKYELPDVRTRWLYLSSLGEHTEAFHGEISDYLVSHPEVKLAFQPGTFQIRMGTEKLKTIYARTEVFFCNKEEAARILEIEETDVKKLAMALHALGPRVVIITDGHEGAYAYQNDVFWKMPTYPDPKPPYERTGAGDAFSSTLTVALAMGMDISTALRWAPINSMSVVQAVGAQEGLLSREKIEAYLASAPEWYRPSQI